MQLTKDKKNQLKTAREFYTNELINELKDKELQKARMEEIRMQKIMKVKQKNQRHQEVMVNYEVKYMEDLHLKQLKVSSYKYVNLTLASKNDTKVRGEVADC